jgi:hypothetical protein
MRRNLQPKTVAGLPARRIVTAVDIRVTKDYGQVSWFHPASFAPSVE